MCFKSVIQSGRSLFLSKIKKNAWLKLPVGVSPIQLVYLHRNRRYFVIEVHTWFCLPFLARIRCKVKIHLGIYVHAHSTYRKESTLTNTHRSQNVWHIHLEKCKNVFVVPQMPTLVHFIPIFRPGPLKWVFCSYTGCTTNKSNDFSYLPTIFLSHCIPKQTHIFLRYMLCDIKDMYINIRPR